MLTLFQLHPELPLMIRAEQAWLVVINRRLGGGSNELESAERLRRTARHAGHAVDVAGDGHVAGTRVIVAGIHKAADAHIPDRVRRGSMREVTERHRRN